MIENFFEYLKSVFNPQPLKPKKESLPYFLNIPKTEVPVIEPNIPQVQSFVKPPTTQGRRAQLYSTMKLNQNIVGLDGRVLVSNLPLKVEVITNSMIRNQARYTAIAHKFPNPIRWYHIAFLHQMEGELDFTTYLGNGQTIFRKTTIEPKGRGPFPSFEAGAIDAIILNKLNLVQDWSIGNTLEILERYNGWGYELYHKDTNAPYIWSGTNQYTKGKYVKDGIFDKNYVSLQIGIAPIMKRLFEKIENK